jgi:hypothetical protein
LLVQQMDRGGAGSFATRPRRLTMKAGFMRRHRQRPLRGGPGFWAVVLLVLASVTALAQEPTAGGEPPHPREKTLVKRVWGVEVLGVRQSTAGRMLEFRYKVIDEAKANPLFVRKTKPVLLHAESGAQLNVASFAKIGPLRTTDPPKQGRIYWMFFENPGALVKPGDKVSVVIGDFRADMLVE